MIMKKTIAILFLIAVLCTGAYLGSSILRSYEQRAQVQENRQTLPAFSFQRLTGQAKSHIKKSVVDQSS